MQFAAEKASGLLARRRVRAGLKPVGYGQERIFVGPDGDVRPTKGPVTAGERYWAEGGTWLSVDVADHALTYSFAHRDIDGAASYQITVTVAVRVADAAAVARRNIRGVRVYIEPALRAVINDALDAFRTQESSHSITKLNVRRGEIERQLVVMLQPGKEIHVEDWLNVKLTDVAVTFDTETEAHHGRLVSAAREMELDEADRRKRAGWAEYFQGRLADPLTRMVEIVAANPTPENVERVASQIVADERWRDGEAAGILTTLIDKNYFDDIDQIKAGRVLLDSLLRPAASPDRALGAAAASDRSMAAGEVIDSVTDTEPPPSQEDSDRNWRS